MAFPTGTPSYLGFTATHTLAADTHAAQHNQEQADIIALANKVGTGASTPASGLVLTASGTGTSSWSQVNLTTMVSGVLPVANGGTGVSTSTGSGSVVLGTSPTLTTPVLVNATGSLNQPTITDFTNSQHNHQNAIGGGTIAASAITGVNANVISNPYKFSVYLSGAQNSTNGSAPVLFDGLIYDTNSNVDRVTHKGRFTAPIAGYYHFDTTVNLGAGSSTFLAAAFVVNGTTTYQGNQTAPTTAAQAASNSDTLKLNANDFVEVYYVAGVVSALTNLAQYTRFSGFLESAT